MVGCAPPPGEAADHDFEEAADVATAEAALAMVSFDREVVAGDVAHYTIVLRVGDGPSAELAIHRVVRERAPWVPRRTPDAILLLHGDFATFPSNFLPAAAGGDGPASHGLAGYLAGRDIDVWGADRRWTRTAADETDFSDYATMGIAEQLDDTGKALAFARGIRALTGAGGGPMLLGGFSHGAQLTYEYAGAESQKPPWARHVKGIVPIDIYDAIPPGEEALRQAACESRDYGYASIDEGYPAVDNGFFTLLGEWAEQDPDTESPFFPGYTNREALLLFLARTSLFYAPAPGYHLAGGFLTDGPPLGATGARFSPELRLERWLQAAPPYQAALESAELDAIWCGESPRPVPDHLADIQVPVFHLGAAGGFGENGLYTTTLVGSSDVTTLLVRELDPAQQDEDYGHGDLLYADDAPAVAWAPLADWIESH